MKEYFGRSAAIAGLLFEHKGGSLSVPPVVYPVFVTTHSEKILDYFYVTDYH